MAASFAANGELALCYRLIGDLRQIKIPSIQPSTPIDGLWQNTCCEAFISATNTTEYREFNFSPSSQWAAYRFGNYRARDESFQIPMPPVITCQFLSEGFQLEARLPPELLPDSPNLRIGLTAVIETTKGARSYWALTHCAQMPDFHLRQSFTLSLDKP
ncbi:MAG: DOMON-like domain-containing protein [Azonexus sp.]|nr:DOMON-like domain-containing protein [Azonexus sp.]